jgi:integrase
MRVKGNGSIRQVKNKKGEPVKNSWQLILSLGYDPLTNRRRQECRPFKGNKTQARRALDEFRREVESGLKIDADKVTFGEYARQWANAREASGIKAPTTIKRDGNVLKHLDGYLGTVPLGDIDAVTVRNLYIALARSGVGQNTSAKAAIVLNQILKQAVNDDILLRNPCDRVDAPKLPKAKKRKTLDRAGIERLTKALSAVESTEYPLASIEQHKHTSNMAHVTAVRLALNAGLRRGEILALSWADIDFDNATLEVCKTLCMVTGELKSPKTETSNRIISLDSQLIADLRRWKARQAEYLLLLCMEQSEETPVITNGIGGRSDGDNLARWWRSFQKCYGFEGVCLHGLRHSHATILVSSGLNLKAVSSRMGHSGIAITVDLYAHAQREDDQKAAAIIGEATARTTLQMEQLVTI